MAKKSGNHSIDDFVGAQRRKKGLEETVPSIWEDYDEPKEAPVRKAPKKDDVKAAKKAADKRNSSFWDAPEDPSPKKKPSDSNNKKKKTNSGKNSGGNGGKNKKKKNRLGFILCIVQLVISVLFMFMLFKLNILPQKYMIIVIVALAVFFVLAFLLSRVKNKARILGIIISILISAVLVVGTYYIAVTNNMLSAITNYKGEKSHIAVAVLKDNPAESLDDAIDYKFGIQEKFSREAVNTTIDDINVDYNTYLNVAEYGSAMDMAKALVSGEVDAIIYNTALDNTLNDLYGGDEAFTNAIRVLTKKEVQIEGPSDDTIDSNMAEDVFAVYLSGNDTHELEATGRSDVNIIAIVNPNTKQILLVSTPRDYYLLFAGGYTEGTRDKLTHAGWYGVECSKNTLADLYGIDVDYFIKVNFDAVIKMVDILGGVDVYSEEEFTCNAGIHFDQGINHMNGATALEFVRERKHLTSGDNQRGRNQMAVLSAMLDKAMSPAIISSYTSIMENMSDCMVTNMNDDAIKEFVKMQLETNASWNVVKVNATGYNSEDWCYTLNDFNYVMEPNYDSIKIIKGLIDQVYNNEIIEEPEVDPFTAEMKKPERVNTEDKYYVVIPTQDVNFRSQPSVDGELIGIFYYEDGKGIANFVSEEGEWVCIDYNGTQGWVHSDYVIIEQRNR